MTKKILPGNYKINYLQLLSTEGRKVVELTQVYREINIFESIFTPFLTGYILVSDPFNLISGIEYSLPIMGNELIRMEMIVPDYFYQDENDNWIGPETNVITLIGRVFDIRNRDLTSASRSQMYEIHFCSEELILDRNFRISKSFKNKTITNIAKNIFDQFDSKNTIQYEKTLYEQNIIIPNWNPIKAINWLSTRAITSKYGTSPYFFYKTLYQDYDLPQDNDMIVDFKEEYSPKFWFVSLDYLLSWEERKTIFFFPSNQKIDQNDPGSYMTLSNALNYEIIHSFDTLENTSMGLFNSRNIIHDITRKTWKQIDYNYNNSFEKYQHTEKENSRGKLFDGVENFFGNTFTNPEYANSLLMMSSYGTFENPNYLDRISSERNSRLKSIDNFKLKILIPGDGLIESGDVINFKMPSTEEFNSTAKYDEFYDGRYLVTSIRHIFTQENEYSMTLECSKESLKQEVRGYKPRNG